MDISRRTKSIKGHQVAIPILCDSSDKLEQLHQQIILRLQTSGTLSSLAFQIEEVDLPPSKKKLVRNERSDLLNGLREGGGRGGYQMEWRGWREMFLNHGRNTEI